MDGLLECPICFEKEGEPKLLQCQHSVCVKCLNSMVRGCKGNGIHCPQCRRPVRMPSRGPEALKTDFRLVQMRDYFSAHKNKVMCESGDTNPAKKHCNECNMDLCLECAHSHPQRRMFADHKLVQLAMIRCDQHGKTLEYFCEICPRLLCLICIQRQVCDEHPDNVRRIADITDDNNAEIEKVIHRIREDIKLNKVMHQPKMAKVKSLLVSIGREEAKITEHAEKLQQQIEKRKKHLLYQAHVAKRSLMEMKEALENQDKGCDLEKLLEAAESAKEGGIQQVLMSISAVKAAIPESQQQTAGNKLNGSVKFEPEWCVYVGAFLEKTYSLKTCFQADNIGLTHDVTFTGHGDIAITDIETKNPPRVVLFKPTGEVLTDSAKSGVVLRKPRGIAFHPKENALVVADEKSGCVTFLDPTDLTHKKDLQMVGLANPNGIGVLSDGCLVVTQTTEKKQKMGVFDISGQCITAWSKYGPDNLRLSRPFHACVDHFDHIWVPDSGGAVLAFDKQGHLVNQITTPVGPFGLAEYEGEILAATSQTIPIYPGEVVSCDIRDKSYRTILQWTDPELDRLGRIISVAVKDSYMAVLGGKGLRLYSIHHD